MKKFILACLIFSGYATITCSAQTVQTISDMPLLEANKTSYIDKPLSVLLADIKPEAQLFFTDAPHVGQGVISFYFVDYNRFVSMSRAQKKLTRIIVSVDGNVEDNNYQLPIETRFVWTQANRLKNQNLIVKGIIVSKGED